MLGIIAYPFYAGLLIEFYGRYNNNELERGAMFRNRLPRIYELRDLTLDLSSPDAYFRNFENTLATVQSARYFWDRFEKQLRQLDSAAWESLKKQASRYLQSKNHLRGWNQLFEILNQARAYNYLRTLNCSSIRFIPTKKGIRTPDLEASHSSGRVLCEAKTMNPTHKELCQRHPGPGKFSTRDGQTKLDNNFFSRLDAHITEARNQLREFDPSHQALHIVFINVSFDDWIGDCQPQYFQNIDDFLADHPHPDVEIVIYNDRDLFGRKLAMKNATLINGW